MNARPDPVLLRSPDWLLAGFDLDSGQYHFAQVSRQTYHDSTFLDHRIQPMPTAKTSLDAGQVDEVLKHSQVAQTAWIFHTGFCCSTLLATCLDHPATTLVLREPLVLSRLAHANRSHATQPVDALNANTQRVIGLCERSYPAESLLLKPSNFANRLMDELFPGSGHQVKRKAILMSSSLESLLVSILKKKPEAETSLPGFLRALLQDSDYLQAAGLHTIDDLTLLQQSVVFWHCQRYFLQQRLEQSSAGVLMPLSMERFLGEPEDVLNEVSGFLGLGLTDEIIRHTIESGAFRRHSKQTDKAYDPEIHLKEQRATRAMFGQELEATLEWAAPLLERLPVEPMDSD
ncbi:MAG TPA: hypothetical protein VFG52_12260 [Xanthomonadales bacterium]|nr:hypothetical protein [Xanthomonadales bacterium]